MTRSRAHLVRGEGIGTGDIENGITTGTSPESGVLKLATSSTTRTVSVVTGTSPMTRTPYSHVSLDCHIASFRGASSPG